MRRLILAIGIVGAVISALAILVIVYFGEYIPQDERGYGLYGVSCVPSNRSELNGEIFLLGMLGIWFGGVAVVMIITEIMNK